MSRYCGRWFKHRGRYLARGPGTYCCRCGRVVKASERWR